MSSLTPPTNPPVPPGSLTEEVWDRVFSHADRRTRKNLRLVSKTFCRISSEHLFRRLNVLSDAARLKNIIRNPSIPKNVNELNIWQNNMIKHFIGVFGPVQNPFVNVTTVFLGFCKPPVAAEIRHVWRFLCSLSQLERLSFTIRDHGTRDFRNRADILRPLQNTTNHWMNLRSLKLTGTTTGLSLSSLLFNVAPTLRVLELYRCELFNPQDHWPTVLRPMRGMLLLEELELDELKDTRDVYLPKELRKCQLFEDFRQSVCDYLLRKTNVLEWDDTEIVKFHMDQQNYLQADEHGMHCIWDAFYLRKAERILRNNSL